MSVEVGSKVKGKVTGITNFGAFVDLGDNQTGLVHISEISDKFIKDIHDVLSVGDEVTVKVLSVGDDGKIGLSIRKAVDNPHRHEHHDHHKHYNHHNNNNHNNHGHYEHRGHGENNHHERGGRPSYSKQNEHKKQDFDSLLAGFLKQSDERLSVLRRNTEGKRGGRGGRRS